MVFISNETESASTHEQQTVPEESGIDWLEFLREAAAIAVVLLTLPAAVIGVFLNCVGFSWYVSAGGGIVIASCLLAYMFFAVKLPEA
jgi:hypothetical protein